MDGKEFIEQIKFERNKKLVELCMQWEIRGRPKDFEITVYFHDDAVFVHTYFHKFHPEAEYRVAVQKYES